MGEAAASRRWWDGLLDRPLIEPERYALFDKVVFATFVIALPLVLGTAAKIFNDGDTSWHLATGRWILEHGQVPRSDPFSFTMAGQPWVAHEWLADIIFAGAFRLAGYAGVAALVTLALTALQVIVFRHLQGRVSPIGVLLGLAGLLIALGPFVLARPHILVSPLMALWTAQLIDASDRRSGPPWWLPVLMVLWVNLHGSFVLGFIIYAALAADAWLSGRTATKRWAAVGLLSLAATLVNANGMSALLFPFTVTGMETLHLIQEWQASTFDMTPAFFVVVTVVVGLAMLRGVRVPPARLLLLLLLLGAAFVQVRHQTSLAVVAALILPACMAGSGRKPAPERGDRALAGRLGWAATLLVPAVLTLGLPIAPKEGLGNPRSLIAAVPPALRSQPVLNEYSFGGPLILAGIKPYIDGRADMYGDAFFADYAKITDGDLRRFQRAVDRYGIRWTMLPSSGSQLVAALDASPEWKRLYTDKVGVIHVRLDRSAEAT